jgi:predicted ArsR family transcriptional regulator
MRDADSQPTGRQAVLALLKRAGPIAVDAAAQTLKLTPMAVRQHLKALHDEGLADSEAAPRARGRPARVWRATARADARFADAHSALAVELIGQMRKAFGETGVDRLLALRTAEQEALYRASFGRARTLDARLERLAEIRTREGYMAEVRREDGTGAWLLVENHCPVCAAARVCSGLCREELALFERVLDGAARVERISHALAGAGRCVYRITPVGPPEPPPPTP